MASPQSTSSHEDHSKKNLEQITFRFCAECSNMLYPKEDEDAHKLQFTCRTCQYTEEAVSTCVFRNVLNNAAGETAGVTQDVGSDPTVGVFASASGFAHSCASTPYTTASDSSAGPSHTRASSASSPPQKPVLCFCCGALVGCRSCGDLFFNKPQVRVQPQQQQLPSPALTAHSETTADTLSTPANPTFSPALYNLDGLNFDLDDSTYSAIEEWLGRDDCMQYGFPEDYEFMNGMEFGNGDNDANVAV